jgi:predicted amidohydrolase YtcJ
MSAAPVGRPGTAGGGPVLYRGVRAWARPPAGGTGPARPVEALLIDRGAIAWAGSLSEASDLAAPTIVEAHGAVALPAFVDAHAHVTETGRALASLDVSGVEGAAGLLEAVRREAAVLPPGARILGHGWDESLWADPRLPSPGELERASGGREVFLSRIDVHAGLASAGLLARAGVSADGVLDEAAHAAVRALGTRTDAAQARAYQLAALKHFAATGHAAVTEMAAPHVSGADDLRGLLALAEEAEAGERVEVLAYWARLVAQPHEAIAAMAEWGGRLAGLGGDLSIDGSIGARTAALRAPYADAARGSGELLLAAEAIAAHLSACTRAGVQAAFHVIGDAGVDAALEGLRLAAADLGGARLAAGRHRLEHVEGIDAGGAAALASYGVCASVQPRFDELWGFPGGLYEQRLGPDRALALNPFATLARAGVQLAFGSDTPVTGARPWRSVAAAVRHHHEGERLGVQAAFAAHTVGGRAAALRPGAAGSPGALVVGTQADLALWRAPDVEHRATSGTAPAATLAALAAADERHSLLTLRAGLPIHGA